MGKIVTYRQSLVTIWENVNNREVVFKGKDFGLVYALICIFRVIYCSFLVTVDYLCQDSSATLLNLFSFLNGILPIQFF